MAACACSTMEGNPPATATFNLIFRVQVAQRSARDQVAALERRMREEGAALERRAREAERQAAEALARADERTKQAERLKEQMAQVQVST